MLNISGPQNDLGLALQRELELVSSGLALTPKLEQPSIKMPGSTFHYVAARTQRPTAEEIRQEFAAWILAAGFRESIEAFQQFLEGIHFVKAAQDFLGLSQRSEGEIAVWLDGWKTSEARFHKLSLPGKLDALAKESGLSLSEEYHASILSLQAARNCLVHRRGFVAGLDCSGGTHIAVKWRRPRIVLSGPTGTRETGLPTKAQAGEKMQMWFPIRDKEFPLGSRIHFTGEEFAEICFTLSSIASNLAGRVVPRGNESLASP